MEMTKNKKWYAAPILKVIIIIVIVSLHVSSIVDFASTLTLINVAWLLAMLAQWGKENLTKFQTNFHLQLVLGMLLLRQLQK